jgi:2-iminobutanoate/2-iminopropanoate deaminase
MRKIVFTGKAPKPIGPYSQAVVVDKLIFLSGQIGISPETENLVKGGVIEETKQIFNNFKAILAEVGLSIDNIVKTTVYMTDLSNFAEMNEIYNEQFTKDYPARATIQVSALPKGACIEIEAIAVLKDSKI